MSFDTLIFSDLHAHQWREFAEPMEYRGHVVNSRLVDAAKVIDKAGRLCERHAIRRVIFAGDLFHRKRLIDVSVFNVVASALWGLAKRVDDVYLLAGNHDLARRSGAGEFSEEHALHALEGHKKIHVIDKPSVIDDIGFVPYASDRDTFMQGLASVEKAQPKVYMLHAGIAGAKTGPIEYQPLEPISVDDLPNHCKIFSGHYHAPQNLQTVKPGSRVVTYIGSPLELTWGDGCYDKRGYILTTWGLPYDGVRKPYPGPSFCNVVFEELGLVNVKGHFCRVDITPESLRQLGIEKIVSCYKDAGARAVSPVFSTQSVSQAHSRLQVAVPNNTIPSVDVLCDAYVSQMAGDSLSQDRLRQIARQAMAESEVSEKG